MPRLKFNVAPKCFVCSKSVYQMEKLVWDGRKLFLAMEIYTVPNFTRQRSQTEKQLSNKSGESVVARLQRRFSLNDLRDKSIPFSERKGKFAVQPKSKKETPLTLPDSNARTLKFKKKNSKPSFSENQHDQHQKTIEFKGTKPKRSSITTMKQTSSDKSKETLRQRLREESMKNSSQKNIAWEENNSKNFEQESSKEEVFRSRAIAIDDGRSNLCCFLDKSTISNRIGKSLVRIDRVSSPDLSVNGDDGMVILKIIAINADIMAYSLDNDGRWSTASDSTMKPGHKIFGNVIGEVVKTRHLKYEIGDRIYGYMPFQDLNKISGDSVEGVDLKVLTCGDLLTSLGYPGISVYLSIQKIAVPTESDVAVVTLGTGSAGILAAQLLKLKCKKVFAISDSAASLKWIEKEVKDKMVGKSADIFFNCGQNEYFNDVLKVMKKYGRVICYGRNTLDTKAMSSSDTLTVNFLDVILSKSLTIQSFDSEVYTKSEVSQARTYLATLLRKGALKSIYSQHTGGLMAMKSLVQHGNNDSNLGDTLIIDF
eukprot:jgi/Bigna1/126296/aug1.2_g1004